MEAKGNLLHLLHVTKTNPKKPNLPKMLIYRRLFIGNQVVELLTLLSLQFSKTSIIISITTALPHVYYGLSNSQRLAPLCRGEVFGPRPCPRGVGRPPH